VEATPSHIFYHATENDGWQSLAVHPHHTFSKEIGGNELTIVFEKGTGNVNGFI
jgi:hypothetical protein